MAVPNNILQQVQVYAKADLAWLLNSFYFINHANKKFQNFHTSFPANLGDTVTFDLPPRYQSYNGLVVTKQRSVQRVQTLACTQSKNITADYTDQQFIFNVKEYMDRFGKAAGLEIGSKVERDLSLNSISGVVVLDPQSPQFGQMQTNSGPYRFFGDGVNQISSVTQLNQSVANFRSFGAAQHDMHGILPITNIPEIVGNGLSQFALNRNNKMAEKWELGEFGGCDWFSSNELPIHAAGWVGDSAAPNNVMTVVSVNDPTGNNVTQITFSEPTSGTAIDAIASGDMMQFKDGVPGQPNIRFLTFIGHNPTNLPVQFRATANANSAAGTVVVDIYPALVWAANENQNVSRAIAPGMKVTAMPSHQAGLLHSGNQLYLAMPSLPDQDPFKTVVVSDPESGASIRHYWGSIIGQNERIYARDCIWGSVLNPDNSMRYLFPL